MNREKETEDLQKEWEYTNNLTFEVEKILNEKLLYVIAGTLGIILK